MKWIRLDPITRKRLERFRRIKRGYYSFIVLAVAVVLSVFSPYLAESRALLVWYEGRLYFPTFEYLPMETFGQEPPPAWGMADVETEYFRLQREWRLERELYDREIAGAGGDAGAMAALEGQYPNRGHWVVMPPIPWDPFQNDFWHNEVLNEIQDLMDAGDMPGAARLARRDRLVQLADAIESGAIELMTTDPELSPTGDLLGLARTGAMPSLAGLGVVPPTPPDFTRRHYLGTDSQGRDVASRLLYGFRISVFFALFLVLIGQAIGTTIGSLQGYLGGRFDILSQRLIEVLVAVPFLYVVIIMAALFAPTFWMLLGIMALWQWIAITFFMRTEMYREKTREYCLAARSYGASHLRIIFRHLLPNCLTPLVTFTPFAVVGAIFALTGLDYLGYGLPAPTPSWGEMIDQALQLENRDRLWLILAPFGALTATLVLVVFIGESVREAFDPKQYARYE
ncbi:MAG: ABC transporter permease subunit [Gammaproteobacteria bacterium]|nr:ABC transporter permease subunit [Gammaproteobacteria bacterium]MDE0247356.1 ABC transporter permease subunit [Gammaproteobacteria bacterium]